MGKFDLMLKKGVHLFRTGMGDGIMEVREEINFRETCVNRLSVSLNCCTHKEVCLSLVQEKSYVRVVSMK